MFWGKILLVQGFEINYKVKIVTAGVPALRCCGLIKRLVECGRIWNRPYD